MNWGKGIALALILFMSFIIYMVVQMFGANVDLVEENYYEQEVKFDERKIALQNSLKYKDLIKISSDKEAITVVFPDDLNMKEANGSILLYKTSNAGGDRNYPLLNDYGQRQILLLEDDDYGSYVLKMNFRIDDDAFYFEENVMIE